MATISLIHNLGEHFQKDDNNDDCKQFIIENAHFAWFFKIA